MAFNLLRRGVSQLAAKITMQPQASSSLLESMAVRSFGTHTALQSVSLHSVSQASPSGSRTHIPAPKSFVDREVPVYNLQREQVASYKLPGDIFGVPVRRDVLHTVVLWQLAKRQQGTHKTKTRSEVRGGGRKPFAQKGTGHARAGTIRAPQWRGGGVVHGPIVRSHAHDCLRKVRRLGLKCALSAKASEGRIIVLDSLRPETGKTNEFDKTLDGLIVDAPRRSLLMVDSGKEAEDGGETLRRAASNLVWVDIIPQMGLNVYSILQRDILVLTRGAVEGLVERLRRPIKR